MDVDIYEIVGLLFLIFSVICIFALISYLLSDITTCTRCGKKFRDGDTIVIEASIIGLTGRHEDKRKCRKPSGVNNNENAS